MLVHGTRDPLVPYDGGMASLWGSVPAASADRRGDGRVLRGPQRDHRRADVDAAAPPARVGPHLGDPDRLPRRRKAVRDPLHGRRRGHVIPNPRKAPRIMGRTTRDLVAAEAVAEFFDLPTPARRDDGRAERTEVR